MDPTPDLDVAATVIGALDSRLRMQIVLHLAERDHFVHELVGELGKSQPLVSQHLRVLKRSGIVDSRRQGREVVYRLTQPIAPEIIALAASLTGREDREDREDRELSAEIRHLEIPERPEQRIPIQQFAHTPAANSAPPSEPRSPLPDPAPMPPLPESPADPPRNFAEMPEH